MCVSVCVLGHINGCCGYIWFDLFLVWCFTPKITNDAENLANCANWKIILSLVVYVCMCVCLCVKSSALHNTISSKIKNWQQKQQQQQLQNVVKPLGFCWFYNSNFLLLLWLSILMLHCVCVPGEKFMENERTNWKRLFCFWNFRNYTSFSFRLV